MSGNDPGRNKEEIMSTTITYTQERVDCINANYDYELFTAEHISHCFDQSKNPDALVDTPFTSEEKSCILGNLRKALGKSLTVTEGTGLPGEVSVYPIYVHDAYFADRQENVFRDPVSRARYRTNGRVYLHIGKSSNADYIVYSVSAGDFASKAGKRKRIWSECRCENPYRYQISLDRFNADLSDMIREIKWEFEKIKQMKD